MEIPSPKITWRHSVLWRNIITGEFCLTATGSYRHFMQHWNTDGSYASKCDWKIIAYDNLG